MLLAVVMRSEAARAHPVAFKGNSRFLLSIAEFAKAADCAQQSFVRLAFGTIWRFKYFCEAIARSNSDNWRLEGLREASISLEARLPVISDTIMQIGALLPDWQVSRVCPPLSRYHQFCHTNTSSKSIRVTTRQAIARSVMIRAATARAVTAPPR